MSDNLNVVPDELRRAAREHRDTAAQLGAVPAGHAEVMASLESLGPVFAGLRDAGHRLLERRRACYEQQAAAHAELADTLCRAADVWEQQEGESAHRLRGIGEAGR